MAQKKNYSRYFIILQEDEKGFAASNDKLPSGYVKLETKSDKCKVSYYVQNLKKEAVPYYMILICNKKDVKKVIKIGELNIDDYGRADISYEYPFENIGESKISGEKISGAAIVKFIDSNIISIMSGFSTTDVPEWKKFELFTRETRSEERSEKNEKTIENKSIFDKYEESIEAVKVAVKENIDEEKTEEKFEEKHAETVFIEDIKVEDESRHKDEGKKEDYPKGAVGDFFKALSDGLEEIKDLCSDIKRCKWYKVPINSANDLNDSSNYNKYTIMYYPMINYYSYIRKYNNFIIGYKCDADYKMKYLIYGIQGRKSKNDQPFAGKSGFVTWIPLNKGKEDEDSMGYWLMFYDFRNSTIVIPVK